MIVEYIEKLIEAEHAYEVEGDVYFRVASFPTSTASSPGAGSRMQVEEQEPQPQLEGEDPRDFALWKATKEGEDTSWNSPWGRGRPGWHIECSAMAENVLGEEFEIHGGGLDLVFPHHENELAQSRALGHGVRLDLGAQRARPVHRREDVEVGGHARHDSARRSTKWGREALLLFFLSGALAQADRLLRRDDGAGEGAGSRRFATRSRSRRRSRSRSSGTTSPTRSRTTSTRRARSP